jgi:hypothetical protein
MAATHRHYLMLAQMLFRWLVGKGYLNESPFSKVEPVGRPNRGKKQLPARPGHQQATVLNDR